MTRFTSLTTVVAMFVLIMSVNSSWGQLVNPTVSDSRDNTAGGTNALFKIENAGALGIENTAFGTTALLSNTAGSDNTAAGYRALYSNNGIGNVAVGAYALILNSTGNNNTAIGTGALEHNTTANNNTATEVTSVGV